MLGVMIIGQDNIQRFSAYRREPPIREQLANAVGGWASGSPPLQRNVVGGWASGGGPSLQGNVNIDLQNDKNWSMYAVDTISLDGRRTFGKKN